MIAHLLIPGIASTFVRSIGINAFLMTNMFPGSTFVDVATRRVVTIQREAVRTRARVPSVGVFANHLTR